MRFMLFALLAACGEVPEGADPSVWLPGGDTTNTVLLGVNAFVMPAQNLTVEHEQQFYSGNSFFNETWVEAPASTDARDGLGPLFNARSCSGCHVKDGKGAPPADGEGPLVALLIRLSVDGPDGPVPDPVYGGQLQDQANPGLVPEAHARITTEAVAGTYPDGTPFELLAPSYHLDEPGYGPFAEGLHTSPRLASLMIGLGLLEAIPDDRLEDLADPEDADGDGISGRVQRHETEDGPVIGRFGWKGDAPDVARQVAGAFAGDMGLTSRLVPADDCTATQADCLAEPDGGDPEVDDTVLDRVVLYSRAVAPPVRRAADDPTVVAGQLVFQQVGCAGCHVPGHTTGPAALPELEDQRIWPYTDLLLHDLGEGLSDDRPLGLASGREWRTPPLWGLGMVEEVSGEARFLHDGRARSLEEAVLWHGGEAEASRDAFMALPATRRAALLAFVADL